MTKITDHLSRKTIAVIFFFILLIIDQVSKRVFTSDVSIVDGFFSLSTVFNTGSAFGLFKGKILILVLVSVVVVGLLIYMLKDSRKEMYIVFALFFAGLFGNLIDRIILGGVIDFLNFIIWPVFNLADSYLCVGVFLMIVDSVINRN